MDDRRVTEAMLALVGPVDRLVGVLTADEGDKRHHLLDRHEWVVDRRLAVEELDFAGDPRSGRTGKNGGVLADEVLAGHLVAVGPFAGPDNRLCRQRVDLRGIEPGGASPPHRLHHPVEHTRHDEHLLLGDAEEIVVVGGAGDDRPRGPVEVGRLVDDDRRIAGAGDDRPLARFERGLRHGRAAGDADQLHAAVLEEFGGAFERRLGDQGDEVVDPKVAVNRLIEAAHPLGGHLLATRMGIDDDGVAAGDHAHGIAGDRGEGVGNRRDRADDAKWSMLNHGQAVVATEYLAPHELDARRPLAEDFQLLDLVGEAADLRLVELHRAELDRILDRDSADVGDCPAPPLDAEALELKEGLLGGPHRFIDACEDAVATNERFRGDRRRGSRRRPGNGGRGERGRAGSGGALGSRGAIGRRRRGAQFGDHLADDALDLGGAGGSGLGHGGSHVSWALREKTFFPPMRTLSTKPMTTASIGSDFVSGVRRALEPWVTRTNWPSPAPRVSTAMKVRPVETSRSRAFSSSR